MCPNLICGRYRISNIFRRHWRALATIANLWFERAAAGKPLRRRGVTVSARVLTCCAVLAMVVCWAQSAVALDPRYPDWPCQQLKVPGIAVASVWTGPSIEAIDTT